MKFNSKSPLRLLKSQKGFSLVEIMIVLAIIGIIVGLASGGFQDAIQKARVKEAKISIEKMGEALKLYELDCGSYPTTDEGLEGLLEEPSSCSDGEWGPEAYVERIRKDPWKNEYIYESDGDGFTITSLGKDKKEGGKGFAKDISNKRAEEDEE